MSYMQAQMGPDLIYSEKLMHVYKRRNRMPGIFQLFALQISWVKVRHVRSFDWNVFLFETDTSALKIPNQVRKNLVTSANRMLPVKVLNFHIWTGVIGIEFRNQISGKTFFVIKIKLEAVVSLKGFLCLENLVVSEIKLYVHTYK